MASSSRTISQAAWEVQKETILHLRFTEGLPLSNNKNGGRTVMQVMRDDHQFDATQSQYEQQLKRWGAAKHMKQSDWQSILPIYNRLKQQGLSPRIRLGDTILDERRVMKAQRRYFGQSVQLPRASTTSGMSFTQNSLLRLEVRDHSGEYIEYAKFDAASDTHEISRLKGSAQPPTAAPEPQCQLHHDDPTLAQGSPLITAAVSSEFCTENNVLQLEDLRSSAEYGECLEFDEVPNIEDMSSLITLVQPPIVAPSPQYRQLQDDPTLTSGSPLRNAAFSPEFAVFRPNMSPLGFESAGEDIAFNSYIRQLWSANDPGSLLESFAPTSPARVETPPARRNGSQGLNKPRKMLFKPYIDSILDRIISDVRQTDQNFGHIDAQRMAIGLENIFLEENSNHKAGYISDLTVPRSDAVASLSRIITSCFVNNLAGLDELPLPLLFGLIKADPNLRDNLIKGLRSSNVAFARALADGALGAAIRAGDEDIVGIILETINGKINEIDLNSRFSLSKFGDPCSPLELAVRMHHLGVVRKLLRFGAKADANLLLKLNVKWRQSSDGEHHAADQGVVNHLILEVFLASGAVMNSGMFSTFIKKGLATKSTLEIFIRATFKKSHWTLLTVKPGLDSLAFAKELMNHTWAETLITEFLQTCQSMGCLDFCKRTYSNAFDMFLISAIAKNNLKFAISLLEYVQPTTGSLAAAVRSRNYGMIQALLNRDINLNDRARCYEDLNSHYQRSCSCNSLMKETTKFCRPATPYAEAILWRNEDLIETLEDHGALVGVCEETPGHFAAAAVAAIKVGDISRLKFLLRLATNEIDDTLGVAIAHAIYAGHVEMVKILVIRRVSHLPGLDLLMLALKCRVREIVFFLLEHFADFGSEGSMGSRIRNAIEAVKWEDKAVIEYMYDMEFFEPNLLQPYLSNHGERIEPLSVLGTAMATRNANLVNQLLDWGADPSDHIIFAIDIGDENMVRSLLAQGAKPFGVEKAVLNGNYDILRLLLDQGATPAGLQDSIKNGQYDIMCLLLKRGADPADDDAFCAAIKHCNAAFLVTLSDAFKSRYPNGKRHFGFKALTTAMFYRDTPILKDLLILHLDVNGCVKRFPDKGGNLLHIAIERRMEEHHDLFHPLTSHTPHINSYRGQQELPSAWRNDSEWEDIIILLLGAGASLEKVSSRSTALLCAIKTGRMQIVNLLLDKAANFNRAADRGLKRTPLQQACELGDFEIIKLLLDKGANVNAPPAVNGGATALQLAAIQGSQRIVRLLLDEGAHIHAPAAAVNGRTALEGAAEHGRLSILGTLLTEGASGFGVDEIECAKALAERRGHRGCVERLRLALYRLCTDKEVPLSLRV
ncbi:unnamed protein product [Clonostachys rosea]|uniref:Clr5 domain-containing protein n=1 Tax=Bionectria ochroleuca TaxID=29856 RepID=A0ABY6UVI8_BIOOC|nr:unnamed protein product [Clonostachys rosea]